MKNEPITLKKANELFRAGRYSDALSQYQSLANKMPELNLYEKNIRLTQSRISGAKSNAPINNLSALPASSKTVEIYFLQIQPLVLSLNLTLDKLCFYVEALNMQLNTINVFVDDELSSSEVSQSNATPSLNNLISRIKLLPKNLFNGIAKKSSLAGKKILYVFDDKLLGINSQAFHADIQWFQKHHSAWRIYDGVQHHGSFYLKSMESFFDPTPAIARLVTAVKQFRMHPNVDRCIVAGTGPSLKYVYDLTDIDRSIIITCNSAIYNQTLMATLRPHFVCATDPIFHAGWGKYGTEFRSGLVKAMARYDFQLVIPTRDYHIYVNLLPEIYHDRICCYVLNGETKEFLLNLAEKPETKSAPNVLTNIMLPLAASLSKSIAIVGCDGKKTSSGYFWSHDPSSQINKHMGDIQKEFKGFFDIDYDKYYNDHCSTLDTLIKEIEEKGIKVYSSTPSYIPALTARTNVSDTINSIYNQKVDVTVVMPARNAGETITETCRSVFIAADNAKTSVRIVVVDDGSSDKTLDIVNRLGAEAVGCGVQIVTVCSKGFGVSSSRNIGLGYVNSEFVTFLDADDFLSSDSLTLRLKAYKAAFEVDNTIIGAFSSTRMVERSTDLELGLINNYKLPKFVYQFKNVHSPVHISSIIYRSDVLASLRFDFGRHFGEDWLYLATVLSEGGGLIFEEKSYSIYSINLQSATKRNPVIHLSALFDIIEKIYLGAGLSPSINQENRLGLNSLNCQPSMTQKKAELLLRLVGGSVTQDNFVESSEIIARLFRKGICNADTKSYILANSKHCAKILVNEIRRFSGATWTTQRIMISFEKMRLFDTVPELLSVFKDIQDE